jgi:hypothetical protein
MFCCPHCPQLSTFFYNIVTPDSGSTILFNIIIVLFVETPRKFITAVITWCFHKQNYYMFYRHANVQRTCSILLTSVNNVGSKTLFNPVKQRAQRFYAFNQTSQCAYNIFREMNVSKAQWWLWPWHQHCNGYTKTIGKTKMSSLILFFSILSSWYCSFCFRFVSVQCSVV